MQWRRWVEPGRKYLLLVSAMAVIPVALAYGRDPARTMAPLLDVPIDTATHRHLFRGIMGLYLAFVAYWTLGAFRDRFRAGALASLVVFMLGLAAGRLLSLAVDGTPRFVMIKYLVAELVIGGAGTLLLWLPLSGSDSGSETHVTDQ